MHDQIIEMLHGLLNQNWKLVCLLEVGNSAEKTSATVVIMVSPGIQQYWMTLVNSIKRLFNTNFRDLSIEVEILPGDLSTLAGEQRSDLIDISNNLMESMQTDGRPLMGTSIRVRGEQGGRTLGGLVMLNWNGVSYQCALTNYHVVKPANGAERNVQMKADKNGSCPWHMDKTSSESIYFTPRDAATVRNTLDEAIHIDEENFAKTLSNVNHRIEAGCQGG